MANLLEAVLQIIKDPFIELQNYRRVRNRANAIGDALEKYVKDFFALTVREDSEETRNQIFSQVFSYSGNQNNPPDLILRDGDAIETKKVQSPNSALALNSSYPKAKLYAESNMITSACRMCEDWREKDIAYVIGYTTDVSLKYLWIVYGDCFAASSEVYERIRRTISEGVNCIPGVEFTDSKEIAKVKKVDPLGITDLRIRGMWHIENPHTIFHYLNCTVPGARFQLIVLMRKSKFDTFPDKDREALRNLKIRNYEIREVRFKNPDNPAQLIDGVLITFRILQNGNNNPVTGELDL